MDHIPPKTSGLSAGGGPDCGPGAPRKLANDADAQVTDSSTARKDSGSEKRRFGPFGNVPSEDVKAVGFKCHGCQHSVERLAKVLPGMVVRMFFYACLCGTVAVWEDENQPKNSRIWRMNTNLMKRTNTQVLIFNGNRPLAPNFSGTN